MLSTVAGTLAGAVVAGWAAARVAGLRRVEVAGSSMVPALLPGDRLLAWRPRDLRPGDLVVVADPRVAGRDLVKRVTWTGVDDRGERVVWVEGDNREASTDSRSLGALPLAGVRGRVVWRYGPPGRAGSPGERAPAPGIG